MTIEVKNTKMEFLKFIFIFIFHLLSLAALGWSFYILTLDVKKDIELKYIAFPFWLKLITLWVGLKAILLQFIFQINSFIKIKYKIVSY